MINITLVAGARPNFMKISPIIKAIDDLAKDNFNYRLVHTGQHYDQNMSQSFFEELNIPEPDVNFGAGSGSQAEQTAGIMLAFEKELSRNPAHLVMVVGDVTSTLACSIVAKKANIPVAHVEGGIRSGDMTMPEEINRIVTDSITDYFFTTSETANQNLKSEGVKDKQIYYVGNTMIDTLLYHKKRFRKPAIWDQLKLQQNEYLVMTLHRPNNVDQSVQLKNALNAIGSTVNAHPVIFPIHPRTYKQINFTIPHSIKLTDPLSYLEFNYLVQSAKGVITDSGGITEETTVLGVPCVTLRDNTERPETITTGTNELIGTDPKQWHPWLEKMVKGEWKEGAIPKLWDGRAAERIVQHLQEIDHHV